MTSRRWPWSFLGAAGMVLTLSAQVPQPAFEVASVKRNASGMFSRGIRMLPGGAFTATNTAIPGLIQFAYGTPEFKLVGGPTWVRGDRFDIAAKAGRDVEPSELRLMVQALLKDRFRLMVHRDRRQMTHFTLLTDRSDRRPGPGLKIVADDRGATKAPNAADTPVGAAIVAAGGSLTGRNCVPMTSIAEFAAMVLQVPVVDGTGLAGCWHYELHFRAESGQFGSFAPGTGPLSDDPGAPSLAVAFQEQLGLKLESTRGPVDVLVIDSVERPTEN